MHSIKRDALRNLRRSQGLTALDLAERAGLSENQVYSIERGRCRPNRDAATRWAAALGTTADVAFPELFGREGGAA